MDRRRGPWLRWGATAMKIRMDIDGTRISATLDDNATSKDFASLLPLTVSSPPPGISRTTHHGVTWPSSTRTSTIRAAW
jgi:hypothetical protein